jgi:hypothetical protein
VAGAGELPRVRVVAAALRLELARGPDHLGAELPQLRADQLVDQPALRVEARPGLRHGHDQRHAPGPQRPGDEVQRADGLQALDTAGRGHQADGLVGQVRRLAVREQDQPVQGVLERAADRAVVGGRAPDQGVAGIGRLGEPARGRRDRALGRVHGQVQLADPDQVGLGARAQRPVQRGPQRAAAGRAGPQGTAHADDPH